MSFRRPPFFRVVPILLAVLLAAATAEARADSLLVAVNDEDFPFGYVDAGGTLTGFNVDLAHALCRALAADCTLVPTRFAEFLPGIVAGRFDFAVANMLRTPERERLVDFTDRLWRSSSSFMGRPGALAGMTADALAGKRVVVQKGSAQERWLHDGFGDRIRILSVATTIERNAALIDGRADLAMGSTVGNFAFLNTAAGQGFDLLGEPIFDRGLGGDVALPLAKGRGPLRQRLNAAIFAILGDGTFSQINNKYFPISVY